MRLKDRLHKEIFDEAAVNNILIEFGIKWFLFGVAVGICLEFLFKTI